VCGSLGIPEGCACFCCFKDFVVSRNPKGVLGGFKISPYFHL